MRKVTLEEFKSWNPTEELLEFFIINNFDNFDFDMIDNIGMDDGWYIRDLSELSKVKRKFDVHGKIIREEYPDMVFLNHYDKHGYIIEELVATNRYRIFEYDDKGSCRVTYPEGYMIVKDLSEIFRNNGYTRYPMKAHVDTNRVYEYDSTGNIIKSIYLPKCTITEYKIEYNNGTISSIKKVHSGKSIDLNDIDEIKENTLRELILATYNYRCDEEKDRISKIQKEDLQKINNIEDTVVRREELKKYMNEHACSEY